MARFAPLRALTRLAADHAAAERAGVPIDELREARATAQRGELPRRDLLRFGIAGGVLLATGASNTAGSPRAVAAGDLMGYQQDAEHFSVWGLSDERYRIAGGNERLPEAIAGMLPGGTLRRGWNLTAVARNDDGTQTLTLTLTGRRRTC